MKLMRLCENLKCEILLGDGGFLIWYLRKGGVKWIGRMGRVMVPFGRSIRGYTGGRGRTGSSYHYTEYSSEPR